MSEAEELVRLIHLKTPFGIDAQSLADAILAAGYSKRTPGGEASMLEVAKANGFDSITDAIAQAVAARRPANASEVALGKAADQFAFYADEHAKKGTPEADAKAATNMGWARYCASLARPAGESAGVAAFEQAVQMAAERLSAAGTVSRLDGTVETVYKNKMDGIARDLFRALAARASHPSAGEVGS